jgi:broad specificity phosphatase PhoE
VIYLVRHGQTEFNLARRYQGGLDSPLTQQGVIQAERIGALLARLLNDEGWAMVSSPQGRARRTAEIINDRIGLPLAFDDRLREISLGSWDGLLQDEVAARIPAGLAHWNRFFYSPDGESYEALAERLGGWLAWATAPGRKVVAVSHGVSGRVLRGLYAGLSRPAMLELPVPQDAVFRLAEGRIERIDCAPEAAVG